MGRRGWLAGLAVFLFHAPVAHADPRADALARQALTLYQAGDYSAAVAALLKGYEITPDPRFLFNIARAYDKAGAAPDAIRYYHRYLEADETEPALAQRARAALDVLEPPVAPPSRPPPAPAPAPPATAMVARPLPAPETMAPRPPPSQLRGPSDRPVTPSESPSYVLPITLGGVGVAAILAGAGVGIWAKSTANQEQQSLDPVVKPELRSEALTRATAADITMGAGAALVLTSIVLRLTSHPAAPTVRVGFAGSAISLGLSLPQP